jgi:hypothetical protein
MKGKLLKFASAGFLFIYAINSIIYALFLKLIVSYDMNVFNKRLTWGDAFLTAFVEPITTYHALSIKPTTLLFKIISYLRTIFFYSFIFGYTNIILDILNIYNDMIRYNIKK